MLVFRGVIQWWLMLVENSPILWSQSGIGQYDLNLVPSIVDKWMTMLMLTMMMMTTTILYRLHRKIPTKKRMYQPFFFSGKNPSKMTPFPICCDFPPLPAPRFRPPRLPCKTTPGPSFRLTSIFCTVHSCSHRNHLNRPQASNQGCRFVPGKQFATDGT